MRVNIYRSSEQIWTKDTDCGAACIQYHHTGERGSGEGGLM